MTMTTAKNSQIRALQDDLKAAYDKAMAMRADNDPYKDETSANHYDLATDVILFIEQSGIELH